MLPKAFVEMIPAANQTSDCSPPSALLAGLNVNSSNLLSRSYAQKTPAAQCDLKMVNLDGESDESIAGLKRLEQIYGDIDRAQTASIRIQRAYREYRIWKRFRVITEQLRHTNKQASNAAFQTSKKSSDDSDSDQGSSNSRQSSRSTSDKDSSTDSIPFASGATRAAICESLSQAAKYLAASAAAARADKKPETITNGLAKSMSCEHVVKLEAGPTLEQTNSQIPKKYPNDSDKSQPQVKSESIVPTALNFQQLESIRKRQYRVGLNIFNKNPEKGVSFLIAYAFIDCSPPYVKTSTSYYLSNQLHFIDKQRLTSQHQSIHPSRKTRETTIPSSLRDAMLAKTDRQQNCRLCYEEENLKRNIAHFLLFRKGLAKEKIGEYLGNLQSQFIQDVLVYYLQELDFRGLEIDVALRKFSSTLRMPGEAQKIERFVDRFACRYVECQQSQSTQNQRDYITLLGEDPSHLSNDDRVQFYNDQNPCNNTDKNNLTMLSKDEIFILTFAIIMLNTDLHSPSLKSSTRMSANQFVNNLRGVFKSQTINESDLIEIYERVKANQITTRPDHFTHVIKVQQGLTTNNFQKKEIPNLCVPHRRLVCYCRLFEVYDVAKKERMGQHQREIFLFNDILLVTKLARRARANAPQQYTYRQHIPLQGLYVQLSQSAHYNHGIKLCRRATNETVIMFNACNEFDQDRFVDDLNECIAVMDEMEHIRVNNIVDTIHHKQLERLGLHASMHEQNGRATDGKVIIMDGSESDQDNTSSNYSSFNSNSAAGSFMALCTNPARIRCTVTTAAPAPIVVEPLDK